MFNSRSLPSALPSEPELGHGSSAAGQPVLSGASRVVTRYSALLGLPTLSPPLCPSINVDVQLLLEGTTKLEGVGCEPRASLPAQGRSTASALRSGGLEAEPDFPPQVPGSGICGNKPTLTNALGRVRCVGEAEQRSLPCSITPKAGRRQRD